MTALPAGYELTDDPARIDAVAAHAYLASSYWSPGIPLETVARAIANSLSNLQAFLAFLPVRFVQYLWGIIWWHVIFVPSSPVRLFANYFRKTRSSSSPGASSGS